MGEHDDVLLLLLLLRQTEVPVGGRVDSVSKELRRSKRRKRGIRKSKKGRWGNGRSHVEVVENDSAKSDDFLFEFDNESFVFSTLSSPLITITFHYLICLHQCRRANRIGHLLSDKSGG